MNYLSKLMEKLRFTPIQNQTGKTLDAISQERGSTMVTKQRLSEALNLPVDEIKWLAGDGSNRSYFRILCPNKSFVLMQLSKDDEEKLNADAYEWVHLSEYLSKHEVAVPQVICILKPERAIVIDDYGDNTLESLAFECIKQEGTNSAFPHIKKYYLEITDVLLKFLSFERKNQVWTKDIFDQARYEFENRFFLQQFVEPIANYQMTNNEKKQFDIENQSLSQHLAQYSEFFCHRDFHSRNIMAIKGKFATIDFQDARIGSPAYDLVSLVFDSYIPLDIESRIDLWQNILFKINKHNPAAAELIKSHWQIMLFQRQIKALGSFGYLTLEKNRGDYLKYVPSALKAIPAELIFDRRWPFLTGELIETVRQQYKSQ